jgi:monoamine oxidase
LADAEGTIEAGAEFVHGNLDITQQLLKEAKLDAVTAGGKMMRKEGNEWKQQEDMIEGWDKLLELMKQQEPDITMQEFLDEHFPEPRHVAFRKHIRQFVQGFDVAEPEKVSVQSLYREWEAEEENYRIPRGYSALVQFLETDCVAKGCTIITGQAVKQVDWKENNVSVRTASGQEFKAGKILITVPVSILQTSQAVCSINFNPAIDNYLTASLKIGFGSVVKVVLEMKRPIWKEKTGFVMSDEVIPTWWTQYPIKNTLLTGWVGGPMADKIAHHTDEELLGIAINSVSRIFGLSENEIPDNVKQSFVFNWKRYDETLGAYSYATPDSATARELLNIPLVNTLFFAGEGLYDGKYSGTVEAALTSGKMVAERILLA